MGCVCLKSDEKKVGWIPLSKMSKVEEMLKHSKFEKKNGKFSSKLLGTFLTSKVTISVVCGIHNC